MANTWTWITGKNSKLLQKIGRNTQKRKLNGTFLYLSVMPQIKCFPPADSLHCVISSNNCDFSTVVWSAYICERQSYCRKSMTMIAPREDRSTSMLACDILFMKCNALNSIHLFLHNHWRTQQDLFPIELKSRATLTLEDLHWVT